MDDKRNIVETWVHGVQEPRKKQIKWQESYDVKVIRHFNYDGRYIFVLLVCHDGGVGVHVREIDIIDNSLFHIIIRYFWNWKLQQKNKQTWKQRERDSKN